MRALYTTIGYYVTLALFGFGGFYLSLFGLLAGVAGDSERMERFFRRLIRRHFAFFLAWTKFWGLFEARHRGRLEPVGGGGLVVAANHPSLVDITCLLARLPSALCIFKPAIRRNPVLGAAARRAGYLANDGGHDGLRQVADKVAAGHTLVVFPEGTRTPPGKTLGPLRAGFVVIARRADVPVQLVHFAYTLPVLGKGYPWWKPQPLPSVAEVTVGPRIRIAPGASTPAVTAWIEAWWRDPKAFPAAARAEEAGVVVLAEGKYSEWD